MSCDFPRPFAFDLIQFEFIFLVIFTEFGLTIVESFLRIYQVRCFNDAAFGSFIQFHLLIEQFMFLGLSTYQEAVGSVYRRKGVSESLFSRKR